MTGPVAVGTATQETALGRTVAGSAGGETDRADRKVDRACTHLAVMAEGRLYALQNVLELDGRVSAYPASARGYSVANSYLIKEPDAAVLIDTGFAAHEPAIRTQLDKLLEPDMPLSLFPLRLNEFMSINNIETLAARFNVEQCYAGNPDAAWWFDFGAVSDSGGSVLDTLNITVVGREETLAVGKLGNRFLDVLQAPIRLISTRWIYDRATRTLFSSDMFTHVWRNRPEGPWFVSESNDAGDFAHVRSFLLNTRYWWMEGVVSGPLRRAVRKVFDTFDIETLAPGYGAIIRGRRQVARQFEVFDEVLASFDRRVVASRYVDRDEER
jgi:hypothetical protein